MRLIDENGKNLGVLSLTEALKMSRESGLDLIQFSEKVEPPICKIMNYGKYLYSEKKQQKKSEQKQKGGEMKGVRLGFNISLHDLEIRAKQAEKFLSQGYKVRIEMILRGREKGMIEVAKKKLNEFIELIPLEIKVEQEPKRQQRGLGMVIAKE